ncbi:MAG: hypothetical protein AAB847_02805 [Patescibacteria group bacterium]
MKLSIGDVALICLKIAHNEKAGPALLQSLMKQYLIENKKLAIAAELKEKTFRNTLYRLRRNQMIKKEDVFWQITKKGADAIKNLVARPSYSGLKKNPKQNLIIVFDIPTSHEKKRDFLRTELIALDFSPLQKSVWTGHGPIPPEFVKYLSDLKILDFINIFEIK